MSDWSRRRALHAIGTVATVAVAGCSGQDDGFEPPRANEHGDPVTDYELRMARDSGEEAVFWRRDEDDRSDEARRQARGYEYVTSEDDAASLSFARGSDAAAALASFVEETDFESSSVLLESRGVQQCYDLRFRGVWYDGDGLQTEYCSQLRPADVACSTDAQDVVGVGIRVPFSLDDPRGFGSRWSSNCGPDGVDVGRERGTTDGGGGGA